MIQTARQNYVRTLRQTCRAKIQSTQSSTMQGERTIVAKYNLINDRQSRILDKVSLITNFKIMIRNVQLVVN